MSIETEIFKKCTFNKVSLIPYGFKKNNNGFLYSKNILNDTFKIDIEIDHDQNIKGKVIDLSTMELYTIYRLKTLQGDFSSSVKKEFIDLLEDIKKHCCTQDFFISNQTNRISNWIVKKYGNTPEFLWPKTPGCGVFRNPQSKKWYCIIMNIKRSKIDKGEDEVEVINVKIDELKIQSLLSKKGYYKAYHMNKKNWISIILDETLSDETIQELIIESHKYT